MTIQIERSGEVKIDLARDLLYDCIVSSAYIFFFWRKIICIFNESGTTVVVLVATSERSAWHGTVRVVR